jgi:hypothetical protein
VGGSAYQKLGVMKPWPNQSDLGLYQLTKEDIDKMVFKVPSLRNIKKTAPYFHDDSVRTLDRAIRNMAVHQRGVTLRDGQVKSIEVWMDSLTGRIPVSYIRPPDLPKSTPQTPGPSGEWQCKSSGKRVLDAAAVYDICVQTRQLAHRQVPNAAIYDDADAIFRDTSIDAVWLFTLANARPQQIRQALASGKHVLAEKPIAASIATEWQLVCEIEASDRFVAVNCSIAMPGITRTSGDSLKRARFATWP